MQIMNARKYWVLVGIYSLLIFFLSSLTGSEIPYFAHIIPYFDKIFHFFLYAGFGFLLILAMFKSMETDVARKYVPVLVVILGIILGILDESFQSYIPGRSPSVLDLAADCAGVIAGLIIFKLYLRVV